MPYIEERCIAGRTVEVEKYYSYHYGKHWVRGEYRAPSKEAVKKSNKRQAVKKLRRLLNANFKDGEDCLITCTFRPEDRPQTYQELLKVAQLFIRRLRKEYKTYNYPLKYIYVLEKGPGKKGDGSDGAVHIHMVVSWNHAMIFARCWKWGYPPKVEILGSDGQYAKIAEYFMKYSNKTEKTLEEQGEKIGKAYYPSKNLIRPEPVKRVVQAERFKETPRVPKGYRLDKDSERSGLSELTGMPFYGYTIIKMRC